MYDRGCKKSAMSYMTSIEFVSALCFDILAKAKTLRLAETVSFGADREITDTFGILVTLYAVVSTSRACRGDE